MHADQVHAYSSVILTSSQLMESLQVFLILALSNLALRLIQTAVALGLGLGLIVRPTALRLCWISNLGQMKVLLAKVHILSQLNML